MGRHPESQGELLPQALVLLSSLFSLSITSTSQALMSFEDKDIAFALEQVKHAALIAGQHRRPSTSLAGRLAGLVVGSGTLGFIKGMTPVERHAELVYCECLLQKAILGIGESA